MFPVGQPALQFVGIAVRKDEVDSVDAGGDVLVDGAASAWSRSAIRSSMCSMPIDRRTMSSETPAFASSSGDSWRCVVEAGWQASDLASPMLTRRVNSLQRVLEARAALARRP
jgi:hypothetical protein